MQKQKFWSIALLTTFLLLLGCTSKKTNNISLSFKGKAQDPIIKFESKNLKKPVKIAPSPENDLGSFYFKTEEGKHWIKGKPDSKDITSQGLTAKWEINRKTITMKITQNSNDFVINFNSKPEDGILGWGLNLSATPNEYFTGLMERTVNGPQDKSWADSVSAGMNLRGQKVDMMIHPTLSLYAPFYVSSRNYGMFVYGTWPGQYDICKEINDRVQVYFEGPKFKSKIYARKNVKEIVNAHTQDAGPPITPPKWTFSHWRWRDNHTDQKKYFDGTKVEAPYNSMVVEDILMMEALDIPSGLYWVDRPWAKGPLGYSDFEWNTDRFPNPKKMIDWLNKKDKEFMLWVAPWIDGEMAKVARQQDYNIKIKEGQGAWESWTEDAISQELALIDFTNPEAVNWWQKELKKVLKQGVKGLKLDRSEELVPQSRERKAYDGRTFRELRNDYPVEYLKSTYEAAKDVHGNDFVMMPRAGYTGSSKYGVFWAGDIAAPAEGLRASIIALQRSSVMGYPVWGSDIGGYWGAELDREVTARWLAFGAFSPIMEVGPTEDKGLWDLDKEPHYDPQILAIWRTYATLHTKLMDYTYKQAKLASEQGTPIARPLFLEYPGQKKAWSDWETYLYGPDILVSPIWQKDKDSKEVYLPAGNKWKDAWNRDKTYKGGQTIEVASPLYKIPVFIKANSEVQLGNLENLYRESLKIAKDKPDMKKLEEQADFIH